MIQGSGGHVFHACMKEYDLDLFDTVILSGFGEQHLRRHQDEA